MKSPCFSKYFLKFPSHNDSIQFLNKRLDRRVLGIFLDTETNGLNFFIHNILEIAIDVVDLNSGQSLGKFSSLIRLSDQEWELGNPQSLSINGITKEEVSRGVSKETAATEIKALFAELGIVRGQAFFICQNPAFDRGFFSKLITIEEQESRKYPYHWLDLASMHFAKSSLQGESPDNIKLSKDHISASYELEIEPRPHRAYLGVQSLIECYRHVIGFPAAAKRRSLNSECI